ncbi:hypothetical protein GH714_040770 [Hevea brasiliensis]|uniref:DCD domain-containing protein n=1 Tax=Hevea brasiliensis TaxID=3981 RepID=A0A6A6MTS1_HEVBR|nr:hypothetical protein GH714_040770 [Hevea brasiliensis]
MMRKEGKFSALWLFDSSNLLEGYLMSRELSALCEQESRWIYSTFCVVECCSKRRLEDEEDVASKKAARPLNVQERQEKMDVLHVLPVLQTGEPDDQPRVEDLCLLSAVQSHQPGQHQATGLRGLSTMQTDQPYKQHQEVGLNGLSVVQIDQPENQHPVAGLHVLAVAQTDKPDNHDQVEDKSDLSSLINQLVQSGQLYKLRRQMSIIEHWVYFSCNLLEWEAFDSVRCRWMNLPRMNANECFMCSDKESLAVGTELLVFGKEIESHVIYRYSILTNTWTSGVKMNTPRCLFGSASLGEIAILAGGCDPAGNVLSSAELYNSETGTWITLPSMNKARKMCSGVFMDGKFYVIGGIGTGNTKMLTCGEVYDMETKKWRVIPDMFPARNGGTGGNETSAAAKAPPLVAVANNELYAADYAQKKVRKYDKEKNMWITLGDCLNKLFQ